MMTVSLHDARVALIRDRVLDGVAAVLASGQDLTFTKVADAAGVPERTVYRHFPTRKALLTAVFEWVNQQVSVEGERPSTAERAADTTRRAFAVFDRLAPVIRELLIDPEGLPARLADNDDRQRAALGIVRNEVPDLDETTTRRLAAVVQLLTSAAAWQTMRDYWDFDGAEAAAASNLALDLLLTAASSKGSHR